MKTTDEFQQAARSPRSGLLHELGWFLVHNKKWWMLPILVALLLVLGLVLLGGSSLAPLLYPLF